MSKLTKDNLSAIVYFHQRKGDITKWAGWEEAKPKVEKEFPELIVSMNNLKVAKIAIDQVIKNIDDIYWKLTDGEEV